MGDPNSLHADGDLPLGGFAASDRWGGASVRSSTAGGVMIVDVEGELDAPDVTSWRELPNSAITGGATGVAVDLRGCRAIDIGCLSVLVAASGKLKGRGDDEISLVTTRVTAPAQGRRDCRQAAAGYSSAGEALRSLREAA